MTVGDFARNSIQKLHYDGLGPALEFVGREIYLGPYSRLNAFRQRNNEHIALLVGSSTALFEKSSQSFLPYYRFLRERWLINEVLTNVNSKDTFWDIGANVGMYACLVGTRCDDVVAFEPFEMNRRRLSENLKLNGLDDQYAFANALSDVDSERDFYLDPHADVGEACGSLTQEGRGLSVQRVNCRRGDSLVDEGVPSPNVIKIDVEGAELSVIQGLSETLASGRVRLVYCEVHTSDWSEVGRLLEKNGFEVDALEEEENRSFIRARYVDATSS